MNRIQPRMVKTTTGTRTERGTTATEYGLLVGFIAVAIPGMIIAFGDALGDFYGAFAPVVNTFLP